MKFFLLELAVLCLSQTTLGVREFVCFPNSNCAFQGEGRVQAEDGEKCCREVNGTFTYADSNNAFMCHSCQVNFPPVSCRSYAGGVCASIGLYNSSDVVMEGSVDGPAQQVETELGGRSPRCLLMVQQSLCLTSVPRCNTARMNYLRLCNNSRCFEFYDEMVAACSAAGLDVHTYLVNSSSRETFCSGHSSGVCQEAPAVPPTPSSSPTPVAMPSSLPPEVLMWIIVGVCLGVIALMCLGFVIVCVCCIRSKKKQKNQDISGERVVCVISPDDPNGSIHSVHLHRITSLPNGYEDRKISNGDSKHHPLQQQVSPTGSSITSSEIQSPTAHIQRQPLRTSSRQQYNPPQSPHSPHSHQVNVALQRNMSSQSDQPYPMCDPNSRTELEQSWMSTFPRREVPNGQFNHSDSAHSMQGILAAAYTEPVGQNPQSLTMVDPEVSAIPIQAHNPPPTASPYMLPTGGTPPTGGSPTRPTEPRSTTSLQKTPSSSSATNPLYPKGFRRKSSTNSAGAPNSGERSYFDLIPESAFDEDDEGDDMPLMKLTEEDKQVLMESLKEVEIDYQQLELLDTIGEGAFGKVHKGVLMLPAYQPQLGYTKTLVAVKTIKSYSTKDELKSFLRESALMKHFNHPNVLGLIGICLNTPEHVPYIVLPFMANGDLRSFLRTKRGGRTSVSQMPNGLTVEQLLLICHQISCGMAYLAESKFVHRDLAARNCMIDDDLNVKVADFGLTRDIYMVDYYKQARLGRVPVKWMAPESLFDRVYNNKTDVWSFGVTCWEVFSLGRTPYAGMANHEIGPYLEKGGRLSKPPLCPDNMYEVIRWCWDGIPDHRPSFRTLADDIRNLVPENYHNV